MKQLFFSLLLLSTFCAQAQNDRLIDNNTIVWGQVTATIKTGAKWDVLLETQVRRTQGIKDPQQNLYRGVLQHRLADNVALGVGYGYIETFPYGDYPLAVNGTFPEHRVFEQVVLKQSLQRLGIAHRFRMEQRWLGRRALGEERDIEGWTFLHRFRYQLRLQRPIINKSKGSLYVVAADELFIGAGKQLGVNIFDQNRIQLLLGAKLSKHLAIEGGYINQTLMQGRRVANQTIMQHNNGVVLTTSLTL